MKVYEYWRAKVISWPWSKVMCHVHIKTCFSQKPLSHFPPNFLCKLLGTKKWKHICMMLVTWPRWLPSPYVVKPFKNLLLLNRWTDYHKTWYVASGTPVHHSLFKWWSWVDLDIVYGIVKLWNLGLSIGKSENSGFFRNYYSLWPETNWVNEDMWVLKVKVISWPKVIYIWKLNILFSETTGPFSTKFWMQACRYKFINIMLVTWPRWLPCPYTVKHLKIFLPWTTVSILMELCM